jgi:hypothetical protein
MDQRVQFPTFPLPGPEYNQRYMADLINALNRLVVAVRAPGEGRQTTVVLTNLQSNDQGLEAGTIFQVNGNLVVSVLDTVYLAGNSATASVGTVAVTV